MKVCWQEEALNEKIRHGGREIVAPKQQHWEVEGLSAELSPVDVNLVTHSTVKEYRVSQSFDFSLQ
jgi:hypothetical protein